MDVWLSAAKELFALGDFSGSLELIEKILQVDPDHGEARDYLRHFLEESGNNVAQAARLAGLDRSYFRRLLRRHGLLARDKGE